MKKFNWFILLVLGLILLDPSFAAVKKKNAATPKSVRPASSVSSRQAEVRQIEQIIPEASFFGELGLGGGGLIAGLGYGNNWNDKVRYSGRIGYGIGNGYSIISLDIGQLSYNMRTYFLGIGLSYVMYSNLVQDIPGVFGRIPNKNLFGLEMVIGRRFGDITGRLGYSTALGLRLSAGYGF